MAGLRGCSINGNPRVNKSLLLIVGIFGLFDSFQIPYFVAPKIMGSYLVVCALQQQLHALTVV